MSNLNRAQLLGNVGASPELSYLPDGKAVVKLSIATNEEWVDKQGKKQQHTEWHRVTAWGKLAENCSKYLTTGRQVLVEGKIRTRSWEADGKRHYSTEIQPSQPPSFSGARISISGLISTVRGAVWSNRSSSARL